MTDFIIVGRGLSAFVLAHTFKQNGLTFKIIGNPSLSSSSLVAGGIWNPIVFKRLLASWLAHETVPFLKNFYGEAERKFGKKIMYPKPILKPFTEQQEKDLWIRKSKNELGEFLGEVIKLGEYHLNGCIANGEAGLVLNSGIIDVASFIQQSEVLFKEDVLDETFEYSLLSQNAEKVSYKTVGAKNIVFCEGYLVKNNPYFHWLPMKPAKGEILEIECQELELNNCILNKGNFIFKSGTGNSYKTGSTYNWIDLTDDPSQEGKQELENKLKKLVSTNYSILKHRAGVRPSSIDRRPIIGVHPTMSNVFVFNGMGTKGVMLAPWFANNFVFFYLQKQGLNPEADVKRFYHLYPGAA
jgi:hypothetical protein